MINLTPYANFTMRSLRSQRIWPRNSSPLPIFALCSLCTKNTNEIFSHVKKKVFTGLYSSLKMLRTSHNSVAYRTTFNINNHRDFFKSLLIVEESAHSTLQCCFNPAFLLVCTCLCMAPKLSAQQLWDYCRLV